MIKLAPTLNEFHTLQHKNLAHSHLSTHNVFVAFPNAQVGSYEEADVFLDGIEMADFIKCANMYSAYRNCCVWSAPEILRQPKMILDPCPSMDVYSFGIMAWEIVHEAVPFDGNLNLCSQ